MDRALVSVDGGGATAVLSSCCDGGVISPEGGGARGARHAASANGPGLRVADGVVSLLDHWARGNAAAEVATEFYTKDDEMSVMASLKQPLKCVGGGVIVVRASPVKQLSRVRL